MKVEIDVYPWPTRDTEDPMGLQGDAYVDGEWVAGFTGPGDEDDLIQQGAGILLDWLRDEMGLE